MTNKELTSLAIKLFAIYVFMEAIILITQTGTFLKEYISIGKTWLLLTPIFAIVGLIAIFFILWKLSKNVIDTLVQPTKQLNDIQIDQVFILHLIGFYLVVVGLLSLAQGGISLFYLYFYQAREFGSSYTPELSGQTVFHIIAALIKIGFGLTLILKPYGWVKIFNHFRRFGLSNK